jgi:hypothetical protein
MIRYCYSESKDMRKIIVFIVALFLIGIPFIKSVKALDNGSVTATVMAQQVAITVTDGSVAYGTVVMSGTKDTTSSGTTGVNDTQTATNTGNVAEDFVIKGLSSAAWTLSATAIGAETYMHEFCIGSGGNPDPCDTGGTPVWTKMALTNVSLVTNVAASGIQKFDLRVDVPSSTTVSVSQSVNVTVTATASS